VLNEAPPSESTRPARKKPWEIAAERAATAEGNIGANGEARGPIVNALENQKVRGDHIVKLL